MGQVIIIIIGLIASFITISFGIRELPKFWRWLKKPNAEWTRQGVINIYVQVSHGQQGDVTLYLYLCGEESYSLFPSPYNDNPESYILAMKEIHYATSYRPNYNYSDRYHSEWTSMEVHSLSEYEYPCLVKLFGECRFRFRLSNDNGGNISVFDSFKFKTELKECKKKCEIKYVRKAANPLDRWKAKDK